MQDYDEMPKEFLLKFKKIITDSLKGNNHYWRNISDLNTSVLEREFNLKDFDRLDYELTEINRELKNRGIK